MGLQSDSIDSRLESLKLDERRSPMDAMSWSARREGNPPSSASAGLNPTDDGAPTESIEQIILILVELTRRIEGLEKKNRSLGDEIRQRGREDRRWRSLSLAGGLVCSMLVYLGGLFHWI